MTIREKLEVALNCSKYACTERTPCLRSDKEYEVEIDALLALISSERKEAAEKVVKAIEVTYCVECDFMTKNISNIDKTAESCSLCAHDKPMLTRHEREMVEVARLAADGE